MNELGWIAAGTVFSAAIAAITTQVVKLMDKKHGQLRELNNDTQLANDNMFKLLREDIYDLRQRFHQSNNDHAACERKLSRMSGRVDYLEELLDTLKINYRKWAEHGSEHNDSPEERTWPKAPKKEIEDV